MRDLRHALDRTQVRLARELGVKQETVSRLKKRSDMLLSTLRGYVEAMGGELDLLAKFPDRARAPEDARLRARAEPAGHRKTPARGRPTLNACQETHRRGRLTIAPEDVAFGLFRAGASLRLPRGLVERRREIGRFDLGRPPVEAGRIGWRED